MKELTKTLLAATALAFARSTDPGKAGWKLDADGKVELKDGNPVLVGADGKEMTVQSDTVLRMQSESRGFRERAEAAETSLAKFKDIKDPAAALDALDKLSKIDQKRLIDAGEVDKVRDAIKGEFTAQLTEAQKQLAAANSRIDEMTVDAAFASSEFIRDQLGMPLDFFRANVRNNFKVEGGKVVGYGKDGNRLMSPSNIGEGASFDEALGIIVNAHPQKDLILRSDANSGTGGNSNGGNRGAGRTMKRSDWAQLPPQKQQEAMAKISKGEMTFVD